MSHEENTKQIMCLPLKPVSTIVEVANRWHRGGFVRVGLNPNSGVVADREEVVNDLEAELAGGVVDTSDI